MDSLQLLAQPWWVNLLVLIPIAAAWRWRRAPVRLRPNQVGLLTVWGAAFGFVEGTVVVYLRAVVGSVLGYEATLSGVARVSLSLGSQPSPAIPADLLVVEAWREAATIVMLVSVALLSARRTRDRVAAFLWIFAVWDLAYYLALWLLIRWPSSLVTVDILFLIPVPWAAQVWFPALVSGLTLLAVLLSNRRDGELAAPR